MFRFPQEARYLSTDTHEHQRGGVVKIAVIVFDTSACVVCKQGKKNDRLFEKEKFL